MIFANTSMKDGFILYRLYKKLINSCDVFKKIIICSLNASLVKLFL